MRLKTGTMMIDGRHFPSLGTSANFPSTMKFMCDSVSCKVLKITHCTHFIMAMAEWYGV